MPQKDIFYLRLLQQCKSSDLNQRLDALEQLRKSEYIPLVTGSFLLDRLKESSHEREQSALLELMQQLPQPLPVEELLAILFDRTSTSSPLREKIAHTLACAKFKTALHPLLSILQDQNEDIDLRSIIADDLEYLGQDMSFDVLIALLTDPNIYIIDAAIRAMKMNPSLIPVDMLLPYSTHQDSSIRASVIKTLMETGERVPINCILAALNDPASWVREAASFGCKHLIELFGARIPIEPLLKCLHDEDHSIRENIIIALGIYPAPFPIEIITTALSDPAPPVRYSALRALSTMGNRVPEEIYSTIQEISGTDPFPHVRKRATRTLLMLNGFTPGPDTFPLFDPTMEELGE